jgi:hypothetical protein
MFRTSPRFGDIGVCTECDVICAGTQRFQQAFHPSAINEFYIFNDYAANRHRDSISYFALPPLRKPYIFYLASLIFGAQFYLLLNLITVG